MIRISEVHLDRRAEELVGDVLRSGRLAQGPMVAAFEAAFADIAGTAHAVAVNNGTTALVAALEAVGVGPGDEVITTPFTFVATVNAILERGALVRLVDIRPDDFTIDVAAVEAALTPHTRAVMPVHLYGSCADMLSLTKLVEREGAGIRIVEDAAQAHGAAIGGRAAGSFGVGCFSFYATKNLTTGEGGMVTTDDDEVADRLRLLRNQGMQQRYDYVLPGHNYRMTELQAAVGLAQITHLSAATDQRRRNAARLTAALADIEGLVLPTEGPGRHHVYHQYTVRLDEQARVGRDTLATELATKGIETGVYYPRPVHAYPCYRDHPDVLATAPLSEAEQAARQVLSLPIHPWLSDSDLNQISTAIHEVLS